MEQRVSKGFRLIENAEVYVSPHEIVIVGMPEEDDEGHNCDHMGCTSVSHVLFRSPLSRPIYKEVPHDSQ